MKSPRLLLSRHPTDSNSKRLQGVLIRVNIPDAATSSFPHLLDQPIDSLRGVSGSYISGRAGEGESSAAVVGGGRSQGITRVVDGHGNPLGRAAMVSLITVCTTGEAGEYPSSCSQEAGTKSRFLWQSYLSIPSLTT